MDIRRILSELGQEDPMTQEEKLARLSLVESMLPFTLDRLMSERLKALKDHDRAHDVMAACDLIMDHLREGETIEQIRTWVERKRSSLFKEIPDGGSTIQ